jgi:Domain of unknown function (DUF4832)
MLKAFGSTSYSLGLMSRGNGWASILPDYVYLQGPYFPDCHGLRITQFNMMTFGIQTSGSVRPLIYSGTAQGVPLPVYRPNVQIYAGPLMNLTAGLAQYTVVSVTLPPVELSEESYFIGYHSTLVRGSLRWADVGCEWFYFPTTLPPPVYPETNIAGAIAALSISFDYEPIWEPGPTGIEEFKPLYSGYSVAQPNPMTGLIKWGSVTPGVALTTPQGTTFDQNGDRRWRSWDINFNPFEGIYSYSFLDSEVAALPPGGNLIVDLFNTGDETFDDLIAGADYNQHVWIEEDGTRVPDYNHPTVLTKFHDHIDLITSRHQTQLGFLLGMYAGTNSRWHNDEIDWNEGQVFGVIPPSFATRAYSVDRYLATVPDHRMAMAFFPDNDNYFMADLFAKPHLRYGILADNFPYYPPYDIWNNPSLDNARRKNLYDLAKKGWFFAEQEWWGYVSTGDRPKVAGWLYDWMAYNGVLAMTNEWTEAQFAGITAMMPMLGYRIGVHRAVIYATTLSSKTVSFTLELFNDGSATVPFRAGAQLFLLSMSNTIIWKTDVPIDLRDLPCRAQQPYRLTWDVAWPALAPGDYKLCIQFQTGDQSFYIRSVSTMDLADADHLYVLGIHSEQPDAVQTTSSYKAALTYVGSASGSYLGHYVSVRAAKSSYSAAIGDIGLRDMFVAGIPMFTIRDSQTIQMGGASVEREAHIRYTTQRTYIYTHGITGEAHPTTEADAAAVSAVLNVSGVVPVFRTDGDRHAMYQESMEEIGLTANRSRTYPFAYKVHPTCLMVDMALRSITPGDTAVGLPYGYFIRLPQNIVHQEMVGWRLYGGPRGGSVYSVLSEGAYPYHNRSNATLVADVHIDSWGSHFAVGFGHLPHKPDHPHYFLNEGIGVVFADGGVYAVGAGNYVHSFGGVGWGWMKLIVHAHFTGANIQVWRDGQLAWQVNNVNWVPSNNIGAVAVSAWESSVLQRWYVLAGY